MLKTKKPTWRLLAIAGLAVLAVSLVIAARHHPAPPGVAAAWPKAGQPVAGLQTFKASLAGQASSQYQMYWAVEDGPWHLMADASGGQTKQAEVDLSSWDWRQPANYHLTYRAQTPEGVIIARTTYIVSVDQASGPVAATISPAAATASPAAAASMPTTAKAAPLTATAQPSQSQPFAGRKFFVDPTSNARQTANAWRASRPADASQLDKIANNPVAKWFGDWTPSISADSAAYVDAAAAQATIPVLVAYNIPQRDCGGYSAGGSSATNYLTWVRGLASGIGSRRAVVILEPDALGGIDCLSSADQANRYSLLSQAIGILKQNALTYVYLDGGNARWQSANTMASRLKSANIAAADGFSLNVSNFFSNSENTGYGQAVSNQVGMKHFVVDTSRSGQGPTADNQWCNPAGRGLGTTPTGSTGNALIDAYLWIKVPGDSDGSCNGGPGGWHLVAGVRPWISAAF